jgi:hypothetical protein
MFAAFEQVARLSAPEAGKLLRDGDAQERVWASWVIARAYGARGRAGAAVQALEVAVAGEPDAGVRRHLLVVLAGLGATRTVAIHAAKDVDADVRATAARYLARLAEPDDAAEYDLLVARTIDLAAVVRYAVADALRVDAPDAVVRVVAGLLFDPDSDVRWAMRRRLDRHDFAREPFDAALGVLRRLERTRPTLDVRSDRVALQRYRPPLHLV